MPSRSAKRCVKTSEEEWPADRDADAVLDVIGDHRSCEHLRRPFRDGLALGRATDELRHVAQVLAHESPRRLLGRSAKDELLLEGLAGLVRRDDEVLLHGAACHLSVGSLLLVERRTSATTNPAPIASWIARHTPLLQLLNTTVIQRPGFNTRKYSAKHPPISS